MTSMPEVVELVVVVVVISLGIMVGRTGLKVIDTWSVIDLSSDLYRHHCHHYPTQSVTLSFEADLLHVSDLRTILVDVERYSDCLRPRFGEEVQGRE